MIRCWNLIKHMGFYSIPHAGAALPVWGISHAGAALPVQGLKQTALNLGRFCI